MSSNVKSWRSTRRSLTAPARGATAMLLILAGLLGVSQTISAADGEFINISTRAYVGTGEEVMIGGFIVRDAPRRVAIHALGPELANRGVSNALADPVLRVIDTTDPDNHTELMFNDDWNDSQGQILLDIWGSALPFATGSKGSAAVLTLEPGSYTAIVEGKNGTSGVALVEIWKLDSPGADGNFANISARAVVRAGDEVMIGGFIVRDGPRRVAIHALGPELANRGVSNALADPVLRVVDTTDPDQHTELMVNDDWEDSQGHLLADPGGSPLSFMAGSKSSAAVLTLKPGSYTAIVEGKNGTSGVALVEVHGIDFSRSPNLIFIMADDLGWADVGYNGASFYETPHIDALCASGMKFTSAYPGASNCMPSRSCIVSGMYITRTQMWTPGGEAKGNAAYMKFLVPRRGDDAGDGIFPSKEVMDPSVTSIAEVLNSAGYRTARFGKWHLGPDNQGFHLSDPNGLGGSEKNYYDDIDVEETLTDAVVSYIAENAGRPFFIYLNYWDVHTPIKTRPEVIAKYEEKLAGGTWDKPWNPTYAAMIEAVDTGVGRIREAVQAQGLAANTLIVFTSDNGGFSGATWNDPLKGAKGAFYEGGIRVPACMSWPGVIDAGSACDTPVTGVDFLPTFARLAGANLPTRQPVDGQSIVPLMLGKSALENRSIFWHYPLYLAGTQYNTVVNVYSTDLPYWRATPCSVIRRGDWKLMQFFEDDSVQLFNLKEDIGESRDLSESEPEITATLLEELQAWQMDTRAVIPSVLNPDFNPGQGE